MKLSLIFFWSPFILEWVGMMADAQFACDTPPYIPPPSLLRGGQGDGIPLWDRGMVPYELMRSLTHSDRETFLKAMKEIEKETCIKFVPRTVESAYIEAARFCTCETGECIHPTCKTGKCFGGGWVSGGLGKNSPSQLFIGQACLSPQNKGNVAFVMHELFHSLGVIHTQKKPDAGSNIDIMWSNIEGNQNARFQYEPCSRCKTYDTDYNCMSIMHYRDSFGPDPKKPTMVAKDPRNCDLKTWPSEMADSDIELLNKMYKCKSKPDPGTPGCCNKLNVVGRDFPSGVYRKIKDDHNNKPVYRHPSTDFCVFYARNWMINRCEFVEDDDKDWEQGRGWSKVEAECPGDIGSQWEDYYDDYYNIGDYYNYADPVPEIEVRCA